MLLCEGWCGRMLEPKPKPDSLVYVGDGIERGATRSRCQCCCGLELLSHFKVTNLVVGTGSQLWALIVVERDGRSRLWSTAVSEKMASTDSATGTVARYSCGGMFYVVGRDSDVAGDAGEKWLI